MKTAAFLSILFFMLLVLSSYYHFTKPNADDRLAVAKAEKGALVQKTLQKKGIQFDKLQVLFAAYKDEQIFDVYAKNSTDKTYTKIESYKICEKSGELGPKNREGDLQVPEGFYHIERFNPQSTYYLSLGINYPNAADRKRSNAAALGGDIFIHGKCATVGCLPMTDDKIKEIYLYAWQARQSGQQQIPVYIFPFNFSHASSDTFKEKSRNNPELVAFWNNLKAGHDLFLIDQQALKVGVAGNGKYTFN
jgi:murein L,D-transpeptidase YafK